MKGLERWSTDTHIRHLVFAQLLFERAPSETILYWYPLLSTSFENKKHTKTWNSYTLTSKSFTANAASSVGVQWTLSIFTQRNHYDFFSTFSWLWQILKPNQELLRKLLPSDYRKYIDESYLYSLYFMKIYSPAAKYDDLWGLGCAVYKTDLICLVNN